MKLRIANFELRISDLPPGKIRHSKFKFTNFARFTLIEIMVVVAIMGLVAAMGMPSIIKALQKEGMRKALSDFQDVCFTARERAIFSHQKTSVLIHPAAGDFSVDGAVAGTTSHGKATAGTLPDDIKFAMLDIFRQDYLDRTGRGFSSIPTEPATRRSWCCWPGRVGKNHPGLRHRHAQPSAM